MKIHTFALIATALAAGPTAASASELGRLDISAPGAMISVCGGMNWSGSGYAVGDKGVWLPGLATCNAAQTSNPAAAVAQSAAYVVTSPEPVDASANGEVVMGQMKLYAHSRATPAAGFAQAEATGGWVDTLTLNPLNPADLGKVASFTFAMHVEGTLAGQAGGVDSWNSFAGLGIKPYIDDASLPPGSDFTAAGQGQFGFPYNQSLNQTVLFTGSITLGTPFELGIFARASAGNASSGSVYVYNDATADFANTLTWAGISSLTLNGSAVAYNLSSASGIDWTQAYVPAVPEPQTWALWASGLLGVCAWRRRSGARDDAA